MNRFQKALKRIGDGLQRFFFPPPEVSRRLRILPYVVLGFLTVLVLTAGAYGWDYTNSPKFCGQTCHTMPPEYTAYLVSPHARVACVECHIGRAFIATQITRKAGDLRHVIFTIFKNYEFPITASDMRPARESCEKCHSPEKFSSDKLLELRRYDEDKDNSPTSIFLTMKTGGGSQRQGLGRGIHWHIENRILYYPTDASEQTIPYVRVYQEDGSYLEYVDVTSGFNPADISERDLKEMDCITCHNRITHLVNQPEDGIDSLIFRQEIDPAIPEIKLKAVQVLRASYDSKAQGLVGIAALEKYYQVVYPDYYAANQAKIEAAITQIQQFYEQSVYPEQKSDWDTHPNNVGHKYFPGCMRCHDGKHLDKGQNAVRLECNLCHSIPVVAGNQDFVAKIEVSRGPEPESHLNPNWISMHHQVFNPTCSNCHNTANPGGTDNSSFCSNNACHGTKWTFAGFDAPKLREIIQEQLPPTPTPMPVAEGPLTYDGTIGPLFQNRCGSCHGPNGIQGLNLTTYTTALEGGTNGKVIIPGDPENSLLVKKQQGAQPHFSQLTSAELELVIEWIKKGAPEK